MPEKFKYGQITEDTVINFRKEHHQRIDIVDDSLDMEKLFENYESKVKEMKVGGLHSQL